MKRCLILSLSLLLSVLMLHAQDDLMLYAAMYEGCVDDEPSPIYGASYSSYPANLVDAQFPGGDVALSNFLYTNTEVQEVYSGETDEYGKPLLVTGDVLVEFVVDRCGKPGKFEVVQSLSEEQDAEALRVMETLPIFRSASINGIRVKSAYIAPIKFNKKRMPPAPKQDDYYDDYSYDSYNDGYSDGYDNSYDDSYDSSYDNSYDDSYDSFYDNSYDDSYDSSYDDSSYDSNSSSSSDDEWY